MLRPVARDGQARHLCSACRREVAAFQPGPNGRPGARCPHCGALERDRLLGLVLDDLLERLPPYRRVLDATQPPRLEGRRRPRGSHSFVAVGALPTARPDAVADLRRLPFRDSTFDVAVHDDRLLQVPDDRAALADSLRLVGGAGLLLLGVGRLAAGPTQEAPSAPITERVRRFGRADRLRWYGGDLRQRFAEAGLAAVPVVAGDYLEVPDRRRFGLPDRQELWLAAAADGPVDLSGDTDRSFVERITATQGGLATATWGDRLFFARRRLDRARARLAGPLQAATRRVPSSPSSPARRPPSRLRRTTTGLPRLDRPPLWVIGSPRSGTTFLVEVLSRHPGILLTNETRVLLFLNRVLEDWGRHAWVLQEHRDQFLDRLRRAVPALVEDFYWDLGARDGVRWGDKFPHYADPKIAAGCLELIDSSFPDGQYVHVVRDGREAVASIVAQDFAEVDEAIDVWQRHVRHARAFGDRIPPDRFLTVHYEDLVDEGVATARRICTFLDVPADPTVMEFVRSQERRRTPYSGTDRPARTIGAAQWRERLGVHAERVEDTLRPLLRELGYA